MDKNELHFINGCKIYNSNVEILNWYRNWYYQHEQDTERGIMARAINDLFMELRDAGINLERFKYENLK